VNITAHEVLTCDVCGRRIERLRSAMLAWTVESDDRVSALRLSHKGECDDDKRYYFDELDVYAHPAWALRKLMHLHLFYLFTAEQARRLALIAWAASAVATAEEKRRSVSYGQFLMSM
jgi:hypothetical protein